jgi:hypothetical protein
MKTFYICVVLIIVLITSCVSPERIIDSKRENPIRKAENYNGNVEWPLVKKLLPLRKWY